MGYDTNGPWTNAGFNSSKVWFFVVFEKRNILKNWHLYNIHIWFWWLLLTPLKNHGVKVSWDDDIPNIWKVIKHMFQTTNQLIMVYSG